MLSKRKLKALLIYACQEKCTKKESSLHFPLFLATRVNNKITHYYYWQHSIFHFLHTRLLASPPFWAKYGMSPCLWPILFYITSILKKNGRWKKAYTEKNLMHKKYKKLYLFFGVGVWKRGTREMCKRRH